MASVGIIRTAWAGTTGGAGLTQLAACELSTRDPLDATQAQAAVNAVRAFWDAVKTLLPNEVTLTVSPVVDIYDINDGALTGSVTAASAPANVAGTGTGSYSMAAGLKVNLNTADIAFGRRIRGGIFLVPTDASASMTNTGLAASAAKTTVNTAGATMLGAFTTGGMDMVVFSRPKPALARSGDVHTITGIETNDKTAVLRGRRD